MTNLAVVRTPDDLRRHALRRDVRALVEAYDLDDAWLARVLHGREPSRLTVDEIQASLGLSVGPVPA